MVAAGLFCSIVLSLADLAVRAIHLELGLLFCVVTALFGTPLFLYLIVTMRRSVTS
jgi:ABC-type Fe3+-siderophore transport system permease subunit